MGYRVSGSAAVKGMGLGRWLRYQPNLKHTLYHNKFLTAQSSLGLSCFVGSAWEMEEHLPPAFWKSLPALLKALSPHPSKPDEHQPVHIWPAPPALMRRFVRPSNVRLPANTVNYGEAPEDQEYAVRPQHTPSAVPDFRNVQR